MLRERVAAISGLLICTGWILAKMCGPIYTGFRSVSNGPTLVFSQRYSNKRGGICRDVSQPLAQMLVFRQDCDKFGSVVNGLLTRIASECEIFRKN